MASEDLLKKAVAAFNALSPEQQHEMMEEQRQSWVRGNVGLSRDERGMPTPIAPVSPDATGKCGELVTVAWMVKSIKAGETTIRSHQPAPLPFNEGRFTSEALVTRESAEAVIVNVEAEKAKAIKEAGKHFAKTCMMAEEMEALKATRSQAEELLAAKDDHITWLKNHLEAAQGRAKNAAINSAKFEKLLAAERAEKEKWKVRGDQHWDTLRSIREMAREGDCERIILWVNDAGSGYTEPLEATVKSLSDKAVALEADNAALTARVKELDRCHEGTIDLCNQKTAQIEALEAKLAAALDLLDTSRIWLEGALNCKAWTWDLDQHEAAAHTLGQIKAVLDGERS